MTMQIPEVTDLVKEFFNYFCQFQKQLIAKKEYKDSYKDLFRKFIHSHTSEETEGLIHKLQSIKQMDAVSLEIGMAIQKASKWLKNKDPTPVETPRSTPRKSGHKDNRAQIEEIESAAKIYQSFYDNLMLDDKYREGLRARATLIDTFKTYPNDQRQYLINQIQQNLSSDKANKINVARCMAQVKLLADKAEKK